MRHWFWTFWSLVVVVVLAAGCSAGLQAKGTQPAAVTEQPEIAPTQTTLILPSETPTQAPSATPAPPTASPTPPGPTATPDLASMTVSLLISTSPDQQWKAEALRADPYGPGGTSVGEMDFGRVTVYRTDGSQQWVPYEEWSPTGLGDSYLSEFRWSADGRYLYFTHQGNADGCGTPFITNLRRVDLEDGSLSEIELPGLGLDVVTMSPDGGRLAYRTANGLVVQDLESGSAQEIPYEWPAGSEYLVTGYAWSPDGRQLAFTMLDGFCGPPQGRQSSIRIMDLDSGEVRTLTEHDSRQLVTTGWEEPRRLQVSGQAGRKYLLAASSGTLLPDHTPPDPVSTATSVLVSFLEALKQGDYERAAEMYGGPYDTLKEMNPGQDEPAILLRNACQSNGFQCMPVREVLSAEAIRGGRQGNEVHITVALMNPDGSVFALGPCCGEDATGETQTEFAFTVKQMEGGGFKVLELPPYMP